MATIRGKISNNGQYAATDTTYLQHKCCAKIYVMYILCTSLRTVAEVALQGTTVTTVEGEEEGTVQVCAVLVDSGGLPLQREVVASLSTQDDTAGMTGYTCVYSLT